MNKCFRFSITYSRDFSNYSFIFRVLFRIVLFSKLNDIICCFFLKILLTLPS